MEIGFLFLLTIIFVLRKLAGVINWPWWLVFAPSIFGLIVILVFLLPYVWAAS